MPSIVLLGCRALIFGSLVCFIGAALYDISHGCNKETEFVWVKAVNTVVRTATVADGGDVDNSGITARHGDGDDEDDDHDNFNDDSDDDESTEESDASRPSDASSRRCLLHRPYRFIRRNLLLRLGPMADAYLAVFAFALWIQMFQNILDRSAKLNKWRIHGKEQTQRNILDQAGEQALDEALDDDNDVLEREKLMRTASVGEKLKQRKYYLRKEKFRDEPDEDGNSGNNFNLKSLKKDPRVRNQNEFPYITKPPKGREHWDWDDLKGLIGVGGINLFGIGGGSRGDSNTSSQVNNSKAGQGNNGNSSQRQTALRAAVVYLVSIWALLTARNLSGIISIADSFRSIVGSGVALVANNVDDDYHNDILSNDTESHYAQTPTNDTGSLPTPTRVYDPAAPSVGRVLIELAFGIWAYDFLFFWIHAFLLHQNTMNGRKSSSSTSKRKSSSTGLKSSAAKSSSSNGLASLWRVCASLCATLLGRLGLSTTPIRTTSLRAHRTHHAPAPSQLCALDVLKHGFLDGALQVVVNIAVQQSTPFWGKKHDLSRLIHNVVLTFLLTESHAGYDGDFSLHRVLNWGTVGGKDEELEEMEVGSVEKDAERDDHRSREVEKVGTLGADKVGSREGSSREGEGEVCGTVGKTAYSNRNTDRWWYGGSYMHDLHHSYGDCHYQQFFCYLDRWFGFVKGSRS
jgi:hypothetical protein